MPPLGRSGRGANSTSQPLGKRRVKRQAARAEAMLRRLANDSLVWELATNDVVRSLARTGGRLFRFASDRHPAVVALARVGGPSGGERAPERPTGQVRGQRRTDVLEGPH